MNNVVENKFIMPVDNQFLGHLTAKQIRQSILDIDDSYNNEWDILAELLQNSVDAIRKKGNNEGILQLTVNCQNREIYLADNGIGISYDKLPQLISLFGTDKKDDESSIGEKGVGLKFAIFSCNDFFMKTGHETGTSYAKVVNANAWKRMTDDTYIQLEHDKLPESHSGTEVYLKNVGEEHKIFELTLNQLKYVLRTKTAIGNTKVLWNEDDVIINITLTYVSLNGTETKETLPFKYWLPIEGLNAGSISLKEFTDYNNEADRTDSQKRAKLANKIIYWDNVIDLNFRDIKAFTCVMPGRSTWETISINAGLATEEQLENGEWVDKYGYATFQPGIYMSCKGMPTGIILEPPTTGSQGTWGVIFLLFEDRKLKFDIGRKSIHGNTKNLYKEKARKIFNDFRAGAMKYVSGSVNTEATAWDKDDMFGEIEKLVDLKSNLSIFTKSPKDQEASVAALFFEAIGSKVIKDIKPLISSYKNRYDLYAFWGSKKVVIEFKSSLFKIIKDWKDAQKMFTEINCIVCWDVSERDEQVLKEEGIVVEKVELENILNKNAKKFPSATHTLRLSGLIESIYVIDMKIVLKA